MVNNLDALKGEKKVEYKTFTELNTMAENIDKHNEKINKYIEKKL